MTSHQLVAQLYTVRDLCQTPEQTAQSLARLRAIGYAAVEVAGICPIATEELRKMLDGEGLRACSVYDAPNAVLDEPGQVAERAAGLGCDLVVYSYPSGFDLTRADDVARLTGKLSQAGRILRAAGKTLCYHHHSLEFARYEGGTVLDHFRREIAPDDLSFELDTYWLQHGGGNPVRWCERMAGRLPALHLKDYGCEAGTPVMREIGRGNLDWPDILAAAAQSGCRWFSVEQDTCPGDPVESLRISYDYLRAHFLS